ncbi:MAG: M1 family aminopeptidase, partial [Planctomycetota bacterium]|nr:M1 family aminopeptidase [Planctomycetota bacterium]
VYPKGLQATAYGRRLDDPRGPVPDGFEVMESVSDTEVPPYMFALIVGAFVLIPETGDPRLRPHLVYQQDAKQARSSLRHHAKWMKIMEQTFGVYSYKKYTTAQCPTRWGGFEAPGNVQLSERIFDGADGGVGTLAHEFVHMWFGDGVGYARWHEVWLSEGFASYFGPWLNAAVGGPDLRSSMIRIRDRWRRSRDGRIKTVRDDSFPHPDMALNANTYPKGAWILHMLRRELGDETFFAALRAYYVECRDKSVLTENFAACVKISAKQDLRWFFSQWLDRVGCPELRVRRSTDAEPPGLVIEQTQKGDPYTFWLQLRWTDADGTVHNKEVRVRERTTKVAIAGSIDDLRLDPDVQLLFRQK